MVRSISSSLSVCLLGILFIYPCVCVSVYVHVGSCVCLSVSTVCATVSTLYMLAHVCVCLYV